MTAAPKVSARQTAVVDMRPPLIRLVVNLELSNPGEARRWFLVPDAVSPSHLLGPVNGVSVRLLTGSGRVPLAHFEGQGGFYALLLDAGAQLRLQDLMLDADADASSGPLTVVTAADLDVGGTSGGAWYGIDPLCDRDAAVSAKDAVLAAERWPDGDPELAVTVQEATDLTADLGL